MKLGERLLRRILVGTGVEINGNNPWDIQVQDSRFFWRALLFGSLGFGESYVKGWWKCQELDSMFQRLLSVDISNRIAFTIPVIISWLQSKLVNLQKGGRAFEVGKKHYDKGNKLYQYMLGKNWTYTCAYFEKTNCLDTAQEFKLDLVCKKLGLKRGQTVLDIGCGWGSFAHWAATRYGVKVVGVTVSEEQAKFARTLCKNLPVVIILQDYRDIHGSFDHVVSLGMFEHVGSKNYQTYMKVVHRVLKPNGLFLLHTIGSPTTTTIPDPWMSKYIFPNSKVPSLREIHTAAEGLFTTKDLHEFGHYYDHTLMAWYSNFTSHWNELKEIYTNEFFLMWSYYLLACAGNFRAGKLQLWQVVFSRNQDNVSYTSMR